MINDEMKIYHSDKLIIRACFSFTEHEIAADAECGLFSQNAFIQKQIKQKRSADLCRWENTTGQSEHNDSRNSNNKHRWPTDNGQAEIQINQNSPDTRSEIIKEMFMCLFWQGGGGGIENWALDLPLVVYLKTIWSKQRKNAKKFICVNLKAAESLKYF